MNGRRDVNKYFVLLLAPFMGDEQEVIVSSAGRVRQEACVYIDPSGERPVYSLNLFGNKAVLLHKEVTNYVKRRMSGDVSRNVSEPY